MRKVLLQVSQEYDKDKKTLVPRYIPFEQGTKEQRDNAPRIILNKRDEVVARLTEEDLKQFDALTETPELIATGKWRSI